MLQEEAVRLASALGNPLGEKWTFADLASGEIPDFENDEPVLLANPKGLVFGRAISAALKVRKAETPVGVCLENGEVFVTTLEAVGEYDELLTCGGVVVIGGKRTEFLMDEDGDVCGISSE